MSDELLEPGLILRADRAQQDRCAACGIRFLQFLRVGTDGKPFGSAAPGRRDAHASVEGNDPSRIGQQRIDIELDDLRYVGNELRRTDQYAANGVQVRRRPLAISGQQPRYPGAEDDLAGQRNVKWRQRTAGRQSLPRRTS